MTTTATTISTATAAAAPQALDHAGIAARIPHAGSMCLLHALLWWTADEVCCSAIGHADPAHPLRVESGLLSPCAIEYAAQAMALHGGLTAPMDMQPGTPLGTHPAPGFLASARQVRLHVPRLDTAAGPLRVHAVRLAGSAQQALYAFTLFDAGGAPLVDGRAAVVLNQPLSV